ncbi:hypothetical protein [Streptomyces sp. NRRL S-37]|uniref:hypothetical protein n=1 Tax=Streptomyces sp. NRRL S-37 TaxID=1463903 RepID=UPI0018FEBB17|nr:hypothetical protein [Streptomyces sp. NRRL S-37]
MAGSERRRRLLRCDSEYVGGTLPSFAVVGRHRRPELGASQGDQRGERLCVAAAEQVNQLSSRVGQGVDQVVRFGVVSMLADGLRQHRLRQQFDFQPF